MTATFKALVDKWGVLLNYDALSSVMDRSPDGLRLSLAENREGWAKLINLAKVRIGRRVLFRTEQIAQLIDCGLEDVPVDEINASRPPSTSGHGKVSRMTRVVR